MGYGILTADRAEKSSVPEELAADMAERSSVHGILTADRAEKSSVPEELAADMAERSSVYGILTPQVRNSFLPYRLLISHVRNSFPPCQPLTPGPSVDRSPPLHQPHLSRHNASLRQCHKTNFSSYLFPQKYLSKIYM